MSILVLFLSEISATTSVLDAFLTHKTAGVNPCWVGKLLALISLNCRPSASRMWAASGIRLSSPVPKCEGPGGTLIVV